jgi:hypothetical protein
MYLISSYLKKYQKAILYIIHALIYIQQHNFCDRLSRAASYVKRWRILHGRKCNTKLKMQNLAKIQKHHTISLNLAAHFQILRQLCLLFDPIILLYLKWNKICLS